MGRGGDKAGALRSSAYRRSRPLRGKVEVDVNPSRTAAAPDSSRGGVDTGSNTEKKPPVPHPTSQEENTPTHLFVEDSPSADILTSQLQV